MGDKLHKTKECFEKFQFPFDIPSESIKMMDTQVIRSELLDTMKNLVIESFKTQTDLESFGLFIKEALQESEEGKWFCGMWYEGMKAGTYWSHQRVKFAFEFDDTEFFVTIA